MKYIKPELLVVRTVIEPTLITTSLRLKKETVDGNQALSKSQEYIDFDNED